MAMPPSSPPTSPPPTEVTSQSPSTLKWTRKATRLRSLATRPAGADRPVVHVDPATRKADGPHKKKLRTYLGIVARDKVDMTYENWKQVPAAQKDLIWEDIQTMGERWRQFKSDLTSKWALATDKDSVDDTVCEKYNIRKEKWANFVRAAETPLGRMCEKRHMPSRSKTLPPPHETTRGGYEYLEKNTEAMIDPLSPIRQHVKWKMAHTKKIGQMTSETVKEIAEKIVSYFQSIIVIIYVYCVTRTPWSCAYCWSRTRAADSTNQGPAGGVDHIKSESTADFQSQMQAQVLALPPEPKVGPSAAPVSTKESCVDPSGNDPNTGDSDKCGLYIEENPPHLVALGKVYEGPTTVHNIPLLQDQVKVSVEEVRDTDAPIPIPTEEVKIASDRPDHEVMWDATVFGVFNEDLPLYIKHENLSEIAHGGQCLSIFVIQLWIFNRHLTETSMRAMNSNVYGFLEPQSIQRSGQSQFESESYKKNWMQNSKQDVYLGAYLNGAHWQMAIILPKENLVVWFCSLHNRPDNYLKGIINSALKGLDDTLQLKSKAGARWIVVKTIGSREIEGALHPMGKVLSQS
ncbi:hypothetical protein HKD37_17G048645 [Glycine soja]